MRKDDVMPFVVAQIRRPIGGKDAASTIKAWPTVTYSQGGFLVGHVAAPFDDGAQSGLRWRNLHPDRDTSPNLIIGKEIGRAWRGE